MNKNVSEQGDIVCWIVTEQYDLVCTKEYRLLVIIEPSSNFDSLVVGIRRYRSLGKGQEVPSGPILE